MQFRSHVQPQKACSVLKNIDLPKLSLEGYTEEIYKANKFIPPPTDGSTITFFNTVKVPLFRCMCENIQVDTASITGAKSDSTDAMKDDAETTAKKVESDLQAKENLIFSQNSDVTTVPVLVTALALQEKAAALALEEKQVQESDSATFESANSFLETKAGTKGDDGQAYWLPPASGDESAGGGGAAPASPGTSQYSVSPQAFYQGAAGGGAGGAAAPASSFLQVSNETKKLQNWTTYSTNFKNPIETAKRYKQRQTEQVHHLLALMNAPKDMVESSNTTNIDPQLSSTAEDGMDGTNDDDIVDVDNVDNVDETAQESEGETIVESSSNAKGEEGEVATSLMEETAQPTNPVKVDMTQMSDEENTMLFTHVHNEEEDSKNALAKAGQMIAQQEENYRRDALIKQQQEKENELKAALKNELRSQLNGTRFLKM